ncbi:N-acetylglucosaminyl-phosphatidylinositol de-N-acetylase [Salvelinus sp. IW2-2015]|uniref:N-acetylglucosaminyl-phosphatidylinositol de-N-acetylase n=1 Tax=Salvelinus sp. IW2-2015 TaxID=2691554 RepID=UPI0038D4CF19
MSLTTCSTPVDHRLKITGIDKHPSMAYICLDGRENSNTLQHQLVCIARSPIFYFDHLFKNNGNYYNQGFQRREELLDSCAVLGIPASQVTIHNCKELPDNPNVEWSISMASSLILKHIRAHSINLVLTFDGRGVSGHSNHTAIYKAVSYLASIGNIPDDCSLLSLSTIGVLRKYLSFLELPISWLLPSDLCCVIGSKGYVQAKRAMLCHRTQLLWFRYLYIWFSRYMIINTFQVIDQGPKNLKIY